MLMGSQPENSPGILPELPTFRYEDNRWRARLSWIRAPEGRNIPQITVLIRVLAVSQKKRRPYGPPWTIGNPCYFPAAAPFANPEAGTLLYIDAIFANRCSMS